MLSQIFWNETQPPSNSELNPFLTKSDLENDNMNDNLTELGRNNKQKLENIEWSNDEYEDLDENKGYQRENAIIYWY